MWASASNIEVELYHAEHDEVSEFATSQTFNLTSMLYTLSTFFGIPQCGMGVSNEG